MLYLGCDQRRDRENNVRSCWIPGKLCLSLEFSSSYLLYIFTVLRILFCGRLGSLTGVSSANSTIFGGGGGGGDGGIFGDGNFGDGGIDLCDSRAYNGETAKAVVEEEAAEVVGIETLAGWS
ncbi:hypothetical protein TorRG33x02_134360 [Trema orientale]|uniref:Uncharacterized protein n=1 Tax=Trema orientale TaxID=63057 RepID=A0A2P5EZ36_TREOI|nr:hypothetical protein TorRG33x02_134360 [Trema orientale]